MNFLTLLATMGPLGMRMKAPGTWGSLVGLGFGWALQSAPAFGGDEEAVFSKIALLFIAAAFSAFVIARAEETLQSHDDSRIVIDEVVGQAIVVAFLPATPLMFGFAFLMFRLLDIWKPGPIGWCDQNLPGPWGTLIDDVVAGILALGIVKLAVMQFPF